MSRALFLVILALLAGGPAQAANEPTLMVTNEDVPIKDPALVKKLTALLEKEGLLTSTRQVNSYMIAVLCERSPPPSKLKPICSLRRLQPAP